MKPKTKVMWLLLSLPAIFFLFVSVMCFVFSPPSIIGQWESKASKSQLIFSEDGTVIIIHVDPDGTTNKTVETYGILKGGVRLYIKNSDALNLLDSHEDSLHWRERSATYVKLSNKSLNSDDKGERK